MLRSKKRLRNSGRNLKEVLSSPRTKRKSRNKFISTNKNSLRSSSATSGMDWKKQRKKPGKNPKATCPRPTGKTSTQNTISELDEIDRSEFEKGNLSKKKKQGNREIEQLRPIAKSPQTDEWQLNMKPTCKSSLLRKYGKPFS